MSDQGKQTSDIHNAREYGQRDRVCVDIYWIRQHVSDNSAFKGTEEHMHEPLLCRNEAWMTWYAHECASVPGLTVPTEAAGVRVDSHPTDK